MHHLIGHPRETIDVLQATGTDVADTRHRDHQEPDATGPTEPYGFYQKSKLMTGWGVWRGVGGGEGRGWTMEVNWRYMLTFTGFCYIIECYIFYAW